MNVKEYLNRVIRANQEIDVMTERLSELRSLAAKVNMTVSDMPVSPTRRTDKLEDIVLKIMAQEDAINSEIDRIISLRGEVAELIREGCDDKERDVLQLRYLCGKSWNETAEKMGINPRHVRRLHDSGIRRLNKIFQKSSEMS